MSEKKAYSKIYYFIFGEIFKSALADGLLLESEWQQVTSGLQDSGQYSVRSQQCCGLNSLDSFSDFQLF